MCLTIYHLDPAKCRSAPGLAWQAALKKIDVKLELLTIKGIRGGIYHVIHKKLIIDITTNDKYLKDYDENKES